MTDRMDEGEVRRLLAGAAATVEVSEHAPLTLTGMPDPDAVHRHRWLGAMVAAAVLVLVIGLTAWALGRQAGQSPEPAPRPTGDPVETEHAFEAGQMPSYLGFDRADAVADIKARGIKVEVIERPTDCSLRDVVTGTSPGPGAPLPTEKWDSVTVFVTAPAQTEGCFDSWPDAWRLLRFARGLGPLPDLADRVRLAFSAPGQSNPSVTVDSTELADPKSAAWTVCDGATCHAVPALLRDLATRTWMRGGQAVSPGLLTVNGDCPGTHSYFILTVAAGRPACPGLSVFWTYDSERRIDLISMVLEGASTAPIEAPTAAREKSAQRFLAWARGKDDVPRFADRVRNFLGGFAQPWNDSPEVRWGWAGCSGLGYPDCGIDPLGTLFQEKRAMVAAAGPATCSWRTDAAETPLPAPFAQAGDDIVRLQVKDMVGCDDGAVVELWIRADGEIYGVRLVVPALPVG